MTITRGIAWGAVILAFLLRSAAAADFPSKPLHIIVPFGAGGPTDIGARWLASNLPKIGQPVLVENKPGANTLIGIQAVARAEPDGYTIGYTTNSITVQAVLNKAWNVDPVKDLAPVTQVGLIPLFIAVPTATIQARTLRELIDYARANPGKLNYANSGGADVLTAELFKRMANIDIVTVPYKSEAEATQAVLAGLVHIVTSTPATLAPLLSSGKLRALAVTSLTRTSKFPDMPTADESGLPGFEQSVWFGIVAPARTLRPIIGTLNAAINESLRSPEAQKSYLANCCTITGTTPEQFGAMIASELVRYRKALPDSVLNAQ